jgi:hypothetical protein
MKVKDQDLIQKKEKRKERNHVLDQGLNLQILLKVIDHLLYLLLKTRMKIKKASLNS